MRKIAISIFALTFFACGTQKEKQPAEKVEISTEIVETTDIDAVTSAMRTNIQPTFNGVIVIPPQRHATVTLFMDGVVKTTSLLSGTFVKKGELLAVLENPEYITLQQTYIESVAQEEFLETEFRRQEKLFDGEAVSKKIFQQSKADYLSMKSRREAAAAQLRLIGFDPVRILSNGIVPHLELRSPIDGYAANVQINVGKYLAAGTPVCDIIDKSTLMLKLTVYEKGIGKIKVGDKLKFSVNGLETQEFDAEVISTGQMVDNINRSLEVYAKVNSNNVQFRPGMYVSARGVGEGEGLKF